MSQQWYYARNGQRRGPLGFDCLLQLARSGTLQPNDLVWCKGMGQWTEARQVQGLFSTAQTAGDLMPPPAPHLREATAQAPLCASRSPIESESVLGYAGFWKRFAAAIIDFGITYIGGFVLGFIVGFAMSANGEEPEIIDGVSIILSVLVGWLYFSVMESSPMQGSLGKMALGIKVADLYGERIGFGKATGRHFGKYVSAILFGIGFVIVAFTQKKQGLHDIMAGCLVVNR